MRKKSAMYKPMALACAIILLLQLCACSSPAAIDDDPQEVKYGWGDNAGGRQSVTLDEINQGALGDQIIFNVLSNSPIGDEKNFVGAREVTGKNEGVKNVWNGNTIEAKNGQKYYVRLYVDNCSPNGMDAVSESTRVAFNVPTNSGTQLVVNGFLFSYNATPSEYWDGVCFQSETPFHLEFEPGSALLENNGIGADGGIRLGDEIVTKASSENGVLIGYDELDGRIPGGSTYAAYVTIQVKVVFDA